MRVSAKWARTRRPSRVSSAVRSPTTDADTGHRTGRRGVKGRLNTSAMPVGLPPVAITTALACRVSLVRGVSASAFRSERSSDFRSSCFFALSARAGRSIWSVQPSEALCAEATLAPQIKVIPRRSQTLRSASRTDSARRERGYSRPSSRIVMMPSEEKKLSRSCSGWGPMMDSTKAGRLYRRMSMDSFERLQRPFPVASSLRPQATSRSTTQTLLPTRAAVMAAARPEAPPPTTKTS